MQEVNVTYSRTDSLEEIFFNLMLKRENIHYRDVRSLARELAEQATLWIDLAEGYDDAGRPI